MLRYLGRYTHRIALSNRRLLRVEGETVTFRYRDSADGHREKTLTLPIHEFIRRFPLHVLPSGFVRIRHAGLLANRTRRELPIGRAITNTRAPRARSASEPGSGTNACGVRKSSNSRVTPWFAWSSKFRSCRKKLLRQWNE